MLKLNDTVLVTEGVYTGKQGTVETLAAEDVPKRIGVRIGTALVWFMPTEVQNVEATDPERA